MICKNYRDVRLLGGFETGFSIVALIFLIIMLLTCIFTVFLYVLLVIAVKNNKSVPSWMYKIGHALKVRGVDVYQDITNKSVLIEVNFYILGIILANIVVYHFVYDRYLESDSVGFWMKSELLILLINRIIVSIGKLIISLISSKVFRKEFDCIFSSASNAVKSMIFMSGFAGFLAISITGLPEKAPVIQLGNDKIIIAQTTAKELLDNGFSFKDKSADDIVINERNDHFHFGEKVELIKNGKEYGYVYLTPKYEDTSKVKDCIITRFSISSESKSFDDVKICDKSIAKLSLDEFEKKNIKDIFSLSPLSYNEYKEDDHFFIKMQTYDYVLWKSYTIETRFYSQGKSSKYDVYAQHTIWE